MKRIISLAIVLALMVTMLPLVWAMPVEAASGKVTRYAGNDRYSTSYAVAKALYEKNGQFENIVIASGQNFPDALSAGYLTKVKNAPLLLIDPGHEANVTGLVMSYLKRNGTVYLVGGEGSIRPHFEQHLQSLGYQIKRLAGPSRYDTNLQILKEVVKQGDSLLVASGKGFADSLSGSSVGIWMLLVGDQLTVDQLQFLRTAQYRVSKIYILGGNGSVSPAISAHLSSFAPVERIGGVNRWETSALIAKRFFPNPQSMTIVNGDNFPDGLSGAPIAMASSAPILLVNSVSWAYAKEYADLADITEGSIVGGPGSVPDETADHILNPDDPGTNEDPDNPDEPGSDPGTDPDEPGDDPGTGPDEPGDDPADPGDDPTGQNDDPVDPGDDPESSEDPYEQPSAGSGQYMQVTATVGSVMNGGFYYNLRGTYCQISTKTAKGETATGDWTTIVSYYANGTFIGEQTVKWMTYSDQCNLSPIYTKLD
ncbi:MAG: cell wall-binding repeat-containing protein [Firmicutes bacterium]|nr:cell wall-binding repeat-containing protein [Bacillota bacterium]